MAVEQPVPAGLGARGSEMWASLTADRTWDAAWEVLVLEACRIADRLEALNDIIAGKGVLKLMHFRRMIGDETTVVMTVDAVLMEAREQAGALRQIVNQLKLGQASGQVTKRRSALDDLAARRADRLSAPAG